MATSSTAHASLQTGQNNINDIRNLTLCKVCLRPFYEPFVLICGHTFCYGCLRSWFCGDSNRRGKKKNCPECRTVIKTTPVPNYSMRDLAHMFFDRIELLPEDETTAEHEKARLEEAQLLAKDRQGEGLFKGAFKSSSQNDLAGRRAIRDTDDDVERCPVCTWELEEGMCNHCGWADPDVELSDLDNDDMSDMPSQDDSEAMEDHIGYLWGGHAHAPHLHAGTAESSMDEDDHPTPNRYPSYDEVDDDDDMGDFISDDDHPNEIEYHDYRLNQSRFVGQPVLEGPFPEHTSEYTDTTHGDESIPFSPVSSNEDEDELDGFPGADMHIPGTFSDEDDEDPDSDPIDPRSVRRSLAPNRNTAPHRLRTVQSASDDISDDAADDDQNTNYDESDSGPEPMTSLSTNPPTVKRRGHVVVLSSDDDSEEADHHQVQDGPGDLSENETDNRDHDRVSNTIDTSDVENEAEESEDSDDSSPPQPASRRIQRLNLHQSARARRSTSNEQRPNHSNSGSHPTRVRVTGRAARVS